MEEIVFYDSWLPLDKKHFRILAMLADKGNFQGSLAQICRNLSMASGQQKTNNALKESIEYLTSNGFISCEHKGNTYSLSLIPKGNEVKISRQWVEDVLYVRGLADGKVSWEITLKVLLWIYNRNALEMTTNAEIAEAINASETSIVDAKNVLRDDFGSIWQEIEKYKDFNGKIRNRGQFLGGVAPWSREQKIYYFFLIVIEKGYSWEKVIDFAWANTKSQDERRFINSRKKKRIAILLRSRNSGVRAKVASAL